MRWTWNFSTYFVLFLMLKIDCNYTKHRRHNKIHSEPPLKLAFLGDQGLGSSSKAVLQMIKKWNADGLVILGDFDYLSSPFAFKDQLDRVFDPNFPVLATVGQSCFND